MKKTLLCALCTFLTLALCVVGVILVTLWSSQYSEGVDVELGKFASLDAGNRASIRRLSQEIKKCPEAHMYKILWWYKANAKDMYPRCTMYEVATRPSDETMVGYETDIGSGYAYVVAVPDSSPIHEVAAQNGTFTDFKKYEIKRKKVPEKALQKP